MEKKTANAVLADLYKGNDNAEKVKYHIETQVDYVIRAVVISEDEPLHSTEYKFQITRTYDPVKDIFIAPVYVKEHESENWVEIPDVKTNRMSDDILGYIQSTKTKRKVKIKP